VTYTKRGRRPFQPPSTALSKAVNCRDSSACSACGIQPSPRRIRPTLEALEERQVPTVVYNGGALLQHVEAQGLYVGDQWSANPTLYSQASHLEGFLGTIVNSSFMDMLSNAGYGVGRGSWSRGQILPASLSNGSTLDDSTIRSWLSAYVQAGYLQYPDANRLYAVFVEPNVEVTAGAANSVNNFAGYHGAFAGPNGTTIPYAVVPYPGGSVGNGSGNPNLGTLDEMTMAASHEIAEAVTDPDVDYKALGWYDWTNNGEVGDIVAGQTVYVNGYAMQRISDQNDQAMTPAQATSDRAVNFVLQNNGDLYEIVNNNAVFLASQIASVSPQGIDNNGHAMIDLVNYAGDAWEYHDEAGGYYLASGAASAVAGQGVSYVLFANGVVNEYHDATGTWSWVYNGARQIDAGTDRYGVNVVDVVNTSGYGWELSDTSGWHYIGSGVQSISAGRQGISDYVTGDGAAHWHRESDGYDVIVAWNVSQVAAGTDANGNWMIDALTTDGVAHEWRFNGPWATLVGSVQKLGKGPLDAVDIVQSGWGYAYQHTPSGWSSLGVFVAVAV
jgi:hypothetical protein